MRKLGFYVSHSWIDLRVGGWRTFFAMLCIAAGVSAVVALQTLGAMIEHSLTSNIQELNRGDLRILPPGPGPNRQSRGEVNLDRRYLEPSGGLTVFKPAAILAIEQALEFLDPAAEVSYRYLSAENPIAGTFIEVDEISKPILGLFLEIEKYPFYGEIRTLDGALIQEVMQESTDIIISDNVAEDNNLKVGDQVRLNGSQAIFIIQGIVDREAEALTENFIFVTLVGFYYIDTSAVSLFDEISSDDPYAAELYIKLSDGSPEKVTLVADRLQRLFPFISVQTTADIRDRNSQITGAVNDLVLLMGLVSLLIGGIGIINTMLVIVTRRTTEIAVLKTIGLKAYQVTLLFLVEAIILGFFASLVGCFLGVGLAALLQQTDALFGTRLDWTFSVEAVLRGFILGIVISAVFGFLPTLIAGQIRPGNVLRPTGDRLPNAGIIQTLSAIFVIFIALGVVSWTILKGAWSPQGGSVFGSADSPLGFRIGGGFSIALMVGLATGIAGTAMIPSIPFIKRDPKNLGLLSLVPRWSLLILGMILQTVLQGVLFFAATIVVIALINGKITLESLVVAVVVGMILGLLVSIQAFIQQRKIFILLGAMLLGFLGIGSVGFAVGAAISGLLYRIIGTGEVWETIVDFSTNLWLVELAFALVMMIMGVLWFLVTLASRLPAFGIPDVKISFRTLMVNRNRVSTTLLALVIGVLTLSLITMFADSLKRFFAFNLENNLGGNVLVFTLVNSPDWQNTITGLETILETTEGVKDYSLIANYQVNFVALEKPDGRRLKRAQLIEIMQSNLNPGEDLTDFLDLTLSSIDGRFINQALPDKKFTGNNRQLTPKDANRQVLVVTGNRAVVAAGIQAGDVLIFDFPNATPAQSYQLRFEIVGVSDESLGDLSSDVGSPIYGPIDAFGGISPNFMGSVVDIEEDQVSSFRREVQNNVRNTVVLETRFLNQIVNRLIDQFTALPIVVAVLNLITGGIVIANSVALSTMERRREISVMKSLGVQRERVLGMLLIENGLMGFLAGIIGVGASLLLLIQLWAFLFDGELRGTLPVETALILMVSCILISLLAAILTAWGASGEKPLNVLRNE